MSQEVLPECQQGFIDLQYTVKALQQDGERREKVIDKLSEAVEKIEEMNANLCKMIALHELKHDNIEKTLDDVDKDLTTLNNRVLTTMTAPPAPTISPETEEVKQLVKDLTRWKYILTGAAFVVGFLLANLNWKVVVSLFTE